MKVLTLHQPYATAIALGHKRYETRSWWTSYRGPLAIHAAKGLPGTPATSPPSSSSSDGYQGSCHSARSPAADAEALRLKAETFASQVRRAATSILEEVDRIAVNTD